MRRPLAYLVLFLMIVSCQLYRTEIDYYRDKAEAIDRELFSLQSSLETFFYLLEIVRQNDFIIDITPVLNDSETVGYTLVFSKGEKATIYFGKDGDKGDPGKDGEDGADGNTPTVKAKKGSDGSNYWSVNGLWLVDPYGNKIIADGSDGISPLLKLEDRMWMVSYDGGVSWTLLASSVSVSVSIFKDLSITEDRMVQITLQDGEVIDIPTYRQLSLTLEQPNDFDPGKSQMLPYQILGAEEDVEISYSVSKGWKVKVIPTSKFDGVLEVTPPDQSGVNGDIILFCSSCGHTVSTHRSICVKQSGSPLGINLSKDGTANCYIVSSPGRYNFNCCVQGGSDVPVGDVSRAEVLWETFGTAEKPAPGTVVRDVTFSSGYVSFSSGSDGNAVIAVTDASGEILWSWHIWVCEGFDPSVSSQTYYNDAGTMMDRNLGALSATPGDVRSFGLFYQWGRKDPFPGACKLEENVKAATTCDWPSPVECTASTGTIRYSIQNPTVFIKYGSSFFDWIYSTESIENTRWNSERLKYDPCPHGWRVPESDGKDIWAKALGKDGQISESSWLDKTGLGLNFGTGSNMPLGPYETIWYPFSGYLWDGSAELGGVGVEGSLLTTTPVGIRIRNLRLTATMVCLKYVGARAYGLSVRCQKEEGTGNE